MITQLVAKYDFSSIPPLGSTSVFDPVFAVVFRAVPRDLKGMLLSHGCGFRLEVRDVKNDPPDAWRFDAQQNYKSLAAPDGSCPVMEASIRMDLDTIPWKVGFPMVLVSEPETEHEFAVMFDGVFFQLLCDGIVLDREAPEGTPHHVYEYTLPCKIHSPALHDVRMSNRREWKLLEPLAIEKDESIGYYTPFGYNTWLGDVTLYYYKGLLHVFYLHDRRHHGSRRGKGAHEFWHLASPDLVNWIDYGPVVGLDEQWQSVGTGNVFEFDGKMHLAFGWHTERTHDWPERANFLFHENLRLTGNTGEYRYDELGKLYPGGASYASSDDGIHFTQSHKVMHYLENPAIYLQPDGNLKLYQVGTWQSDHIGSWKLVDENFPIANERSFARNCYDCPTFFELDGWEYLAMGFTGFWGRPKGGEWMDFIEKGWDFYDGANVPMTARFSDGRLLEGSWLNGNGWGCCLLLREIIPLGNGRLGKRWLPEALPLHPAIYENANEVTLGNETDSLLVFQVPAGQKECAIRFNGEGVPCELFLDIARQRASWRSIRDGQPEIVPTIREQALQHPEITNFGSFRNIACQCHDYTLEGLGGMAAPFQLRILIHRSRKVAHPVLEAEIAGKHVMATHRTNLQVHSVLRVQRS